MEAGADAPTATQLQPNGLQQPDTGWIRTGENPRKCGRFITVWHQLIRACQDSGSCDRKIVGFKPPLAHCYIKGGQRPLYPPDGAQWSRPEGSAPLMQQLLEPSP